MERGCGEAEEGHGQWENKKATLTSGFLYIYLGEAEIICRLSFVTCHFLSFPKRFRIR